jgi:hypothetical protein
MLCQREKRPRDHGANKKIMTVSLHVLTLKDLHEKTAERLIF